MIANQCYRKYIDTIAGRYWCMQCGALITRSIFSQISTKKHSIARPLGMWCLLWVHTLVYTLHPSLRWCMQYRVILDRVMWHQTVSTESLRHYAFVNCTQMPCTLYLCSIHHMLPYIYNRTGSQPVGTPAMHNLSVLITGVKFKSQHYSDVIMGMIVSQITSLTIVYSTLYSDADQRKHQSSASLAFVRGIHRGPVNSPHKWPVTRKMFPFDDVIMVHYTQNVWQHL